MAQENSVPSNLLVVETTGDFMMLDVSANQTVPAHRPALVNRTSFVTSRLDKGDLRVVDDNPSSDLTDAKLAEQWDKGDKYKNSKKTKPDVMKAPGAALGANDKNLESAKDKTAGPTIGSPKQPGESQADFEKRLQKEATDQK